MGHHSPSYAGHYHDRGAARAARRDDRRHRAQSAAAAQEQNILRLAAQDHHLREITSHVL